MKPGRELDALVAEHVIGAKVYRDINERPWERLDDGDLGYIPDYSSSIADAWTVVERLRQSGRTVDVLDDDTETWAAEISSLTEKWIAQSESAPHAICLAALKAVGHEVTT